MRHTHREGSRWVGVVLVVTLLMLAKASYSQELPAEAFFTLRDLGSDGTVDEVADTPPEIGQASFRGSISKFAEYTDESFVEFSAQDFGVADRVILNLSVSNSSPQGSLSTVQVAAYAGSGQTDKSLYRSAGTPMNEIEVPALSTDSFCCRLSVDVTEAYNLMVLAGRPFLGFRFHDPSWAGDPSQGQAFLNDASLEITPLAEQPIIVGSRVIGANRHLNPDSRGVISVVVFTSDEFDATKASLQTVRFGPRGTEAAPTLAVMHDVNGDRRIDLVLYFRVRDTQIQCGMTSVLLTGRTHEGKAFEGVATIRTVGCKP